MRRITYILMLLANMVAAFAVGRYGVAANIEKPAITTLMRVTAYCPCPKCCGRYADGITASGHVIRPGDKFCAAPRAVPFGTMVTIPGYGRVPVLDRGGSITDGRLDVYFPTHQAAQQWGVKMLNCEVEIRQP